MSGKRQNIFMVLTALLLLGGCLWLMLDKPSEGRAENTAEALVPEDMQKEIQEITVQKENHSYTITKKEDAYAVSGIEIENVSQGAAENIFYRIVYLESVACAKEIKEEEAGFSQPRLRLTLKSRDSQETEILVGHKSTLLEGYFAKVSGKQEIYIIGTYLPEEIYSTAEAYQNMGFVDFMYESDYSKLDYLEISGQDVITIAFRRTENGFEMEKPVCQLCDQSTVKNTFLHAAVHLKADEYVGDKEQPEMGFGNPYYLITMKYQGKDIKIRIGEEAGDKRYIKKDGEKAVYLIQQTELSFLDTDYRSAVGGYLYPRSVKDVAEITVFIDGEIIRLTEVSAKGQGYIAKAGPKKVESNMFLPFYNSIRNLELLKNISAPGEEKIKIQVFLKDGRRDEIVLGYLNEREYSVSVNDVCSFSTSKASVENLKKKVEELRDILEL